jgi:hypothetical protein
MIGGLALNVFGLGSCFGIYGAESSSNSSFPDWLGTFGIVGSCVLAPLGVVLMLAGFISLLNTPKYDPQPPRSTPTDPPPPPQSNEPPDRGPQPPLPR